MSGPTFRQRQRPAFASQAQSPQSSGHYIVGYGKPPVDTRFGGKRGNRSGRKAGTRTFEDILNQELKAKVKAMENGRERNITKQEALVKNLINAAIAGKVQPQRLVTSHLIQQAAKHAQATINGYKPGMIIEIGDDQLAGLRFLAELYRPDDAKGDGDGK